MRIDSEQCVGGNEKCVAIGRCTRHGCRANVAASTGLVFNDDGLLQDGLNFVGGGAHDQITGAPWWVRGNDFDRFVRPTLRHEGVAGEEGCCKNEPTGRTKTKGSKHQQLQFRIKHPTQALPESLPRKPQ